MSQFLSQKLGHQPLSHWNQWKFSGTMVRKKRAEVEVDFIGKLNRPRLRTRILASASRDLLLPETFNLVRRIAG
jgi:hypothetical protein